MIKKIAVLSLLLLGLGSGAFCGESTNAVLKGNDFVQKKDYGSAIKEYEKAIKYDPKNAKAHLLLGLTYANTGDLDKSLRFTRYALTLEKSYAAYHNLALIYAQKGEYQNGVDAFESALEISPASAPAWYELGCIHAGNNHFKEAIEAYKKALGLNSYLDNARLGLGAAYYWSGDKSSALEQVHQLRLLKLADKAEQLETWINDKEAKKRNTVDALKLSPAPDSKKQADSPSTAPSITPSASASPSLEPTAKS